VDEFDAAQTFHSSVAPYLKNASFTSDIYIMFAARSKNNSNDTFPVYIWEGYTVSDTFISNQLEMESKNTLSWYYLLNKLARRRNSHEATLRAISVVSRQFPIISTTSAWYDRVLYIILVLHQAPCSSDYYYRMTPVGSLKPNTFPGKRMIRKLSLKGDTQFNCFGVFVIYSASGDFTSFANNILKRLFVFLIVGFIFLE